MLAACSADISSLGSQIEPTGVSGDLNTGGGDELPMATGATGVTGASGTSGTGARLVRLRLNGTAAAEGTDPEEAWVFHDSELDINCTFFKVSADPNDWRCIPQYTAGAYYADANCTDPIAIVPAPTCGAAPLTYATMQHAERTDPFHRIWGMRVELFRVGKTRARPSKLYWKDDAVGCYEQTQEVTGTAHDVIADSGASFAQGRFEWKQGTSGRLAQPRIIPDGDLAPIVDYMLGFALDNAVALTCMFDSGPTCPVSARSVESFYSDSACNNPVPTLATNASYVRDESGDVREVTSSIKEPVYDDSSGVCAAATPANRYVVTLGKTITEVTGVAKTVGTGRVRDRRVDADGLSFFWQHIDTANGDTQCFPTATTDGKVRCVPGLGSERRLFTDAQCKNAVIASASEISATYAHYTEPCSNQTTLVNVGVALPDSTDPLFELDSIGCTAALYVEDYNFRAAVGSVVSPAQFAEMP
jgi:hypothetical protein